MYAQPKLNPFPSQQHTAASKLSTIHSIPSTQRAHQPAAISRCAGRCEDGTYVSMYAETRAMTRKG